MVDFLKVIDFSKDLKEAKELEDHIKKVADELSNQHKNDETYQKPVLDTDLSNIVIVTGFPVVEEEKVDKLAGFFKARILPPLEIPEPQIEFNIQNKKMLGMALLTFNDAETAKTAAQKLNGCQFDKTNVLAACTNADFDALTKMDDEYHPPEVLPTEELQGWLLDHRFREQLLVRVQDANFLQWFDHIAKAEAILNGNTFESKYGEVIKVEWSRNGSYLITYHDDGFCLWGGKDFKRLNFYAHSEVTHVDFSPNEAYVLSFNGTSSDVKSSENYIVWKVATVEKLRTFKATQNETWGSYKWNFDGQFIASYGNDLLNVYELPSMARVADPQTQKRSPIKVPNVQNIEWAPNKNLLCVAAYKPQSAKAEGAKGEAGKIYLLEFPSRLSLKWKTITWEFNSCDIHWENTGNKIILVLKKVIKNKKTSLVVQVGEIKQNNIIVEEHEFADGKLANVDESGKRVAVLSLDNSNQTAAQAVMAGYTIDLYKTDEEVRGKYFQKLGTLVDKTVSHVLWSPNGTFFALVNTDKFSSKIGFLEFGLIKGNTVEVIKSTKFAYMVQAAWDPSGRYLTTSSNKGQYTIWTAFGEAVIKDNFNEITQIEWRPKPRVLLPPKVEEQLSSNLKKYTKKFEEEDDKIVNAKEHEKRRMRKEQKEAFERLLQKKKQHWEETKEERIRLLGFDEDHPTDVAYDEIIEGEEQTDNRK